jgi:hypothetical protein
MPHRTDTDQTSPHPLMTVTGSTLVLASRTPPERGRRRAAGPGPFARLYAHFRSRR